MGTDGAGDQPTQGWGQPGQFLGGPAQPTDQFGQPGQPGPAGAPGPFGAGSFGQQPGWQPPYGQAGPYFQTSAGWPQMAGRRTNSLAIAALCCGVGQVVAGPFAGIPAIVLGAMSLKQIRESGEDGRGMATTGLVLGVVGTALSLLVLVFVVAIFNRAASSLNSP
ncbi:MAG TPA: DUF4190 domain-containing protein [Streptosporangiaceae bacterium]|nr:DUF4190 domain-containing protein [Streptosporangiaceae bacterium]